MMELREVRTPLLEAGAPLEAYERISAQLVRLRALRAALPPGGEPPKQPFTLEEALEKCTTITIDEEVQALLKKKEELEQKLKNIAAEKKELEDLLGLELDFAKLQVAFSRAPFPSETQT